MSKQEKWSEYWQNESASGEVFVDAQGNKHPQLAQFWSKEFGAFKHDAKIIDLACGAGSIFHAIDHHKYTRLTASDLSDVALQKLFKEISHIDTLCSSCSAMPCDDEAFDHVVSQFGIEYAGEAGFLEAARILNKGGSLLSLVHYRDGYIDYRNKNELSGVVVLTDSDFIGHAIKAAIAFDSGDKNVIEAAVSEFMMVEPLVHKAVLAYPQGMHVHAYNGSKQLLQDFSKYTLKDVITWLNNMQHELLKCKERLTDMRAVTFCEQRMQTLVHALGEADMYDISAVLLTLEGHDKAVGWILRAHK